MDVLHIAGEGREGGGGGGERWGRGRERGEEECRRYTETLVASRRTSGRPCPSKEWSSCRQCVFWPVSWLLQQWQIHQQSSPIPRLGQLEGGGREGGGGRVEGGGRREGGRVAAETDASVLTDDCDVSNVIQ